MEPIHQNHIRLPPPRRQTEIRMLQDGLCRIGHLFVNPVRHGDHAMAQKPNVQRVVYQVHPAARPAIRGTIQHALGEVLVLLRVRRLEEVRPLVEDVRDGGAVGADVEEHDQAAVGVDELAESGPVVELEPWRGRVCIGCDAGVDHRVGEFLDGEVIGVGE